jgi:hypothetical protein
MSIEDTVRGIAVAPLRKQCEEDWGQRVKTVAVVLSYLQAMGSDHRQSPGDLLECQMLCSKFIRRLEHRTAAYEAIQTVVAAEGDAGGEYFFALIFTSPAGIEPLILDKIVRDCWDHCSERITSFSMDQSDAGLAAEIALSSRTPLLGT